MNVLSLFDGMSCGQIALNRLGVKYDKYFASEIDKYAMQITKQNYPDTIHIGDVTAIKAAELSKIDLLMGGSPCQGFSFAGSQLAFDDPRSKLFFEFVRLLKELKPKYFLLENVRMKNEYLDIITEQLGVEPILINSALVSAQNRQRYYWTNIPGIAQPKDKGIVLKDILETNADEKFKISNAKKDRVLNTKRGKGFFYNKYSKKIGTVISGDHKAPTDGSYLEIQNKPKQVGIATDINGYDIIKRVYSENGKSPTLTTMGGGHREPKVAIDATYWRKLTPLECERLQTVSDNYTQGVSNTQRYKMLGNGWTVDVICHILSHLYFFKGVINE